VVKACYWRAGGGEAGNIGKEAWVNEGGTSKSATALAEAAVGAGYDTCAENGLFGAGL
jgi:hypothetical protein